MSDSAPARTDRLLQHSLVLMVAAQVANISNVLFHMVMGRHLSANDYGILSAMLNLLLICMTPLDALRGALAHFSARAHAAGEPAVIRALVRYWVARVLMVAVPISVAMLVLHEECAAFFHLESVLPIVVVAMVLPGLLSSPGMTGCLQGVQAFYWVALSVYGWSPLRLVLGLAFVTGGWLTAMSGLTAHAISIGFAIVLTASGVWAVTRGATTRAAAPRGVSHYFLSSLLLLGSFGVLMNCDVMLVRHYHPDLAGHFSWAATIGRSVIFLPMPIAMAMFPKVISTGGSSQASRSTLLKALGLVGGMIGTAVAATWILPWLPLRILYKVADPTPEMTHLVRVVALAMSPLGLTYLLLNFEMAQHRFQTIPWLLAAAAAYLGGVWLWHDTVDQIILVLGSVSLFSAIVFVVAFLRAQRSAPA